MGRKRLEFGVVQKAAKVLRCISHPDRLRLVECLEGRRLTVGEIVQELHCGQAVVSKHLAVLRRQGIVACEAQGNFRRYAIAYPNVINVLHCMRQHGGKP